MIREVSPYGTSLPGPGPGEDNHSPGPVIREVSPYGTSLPGPGPGE